MGHPGHESNARVSLGAGVRRAACLKIIWK